MLTKLLDRFLAARSLSHQRHVGLISDDGGDPFLQQGVIVYAEDTDWARLVHLVFSLSRVLKAAANFRERMRGSHSQRLRGNSARKAIWPGTESSTSVP